MEGETRTRQGQVRSHDHHVTTARPIIDYIFAFFRSG